MKVTVACGGTGGHAFPGLAVAQALQKRGHEVSIWCAGRAAEEGVLRAWEGARFSTGAKQLSVRNGLAILRAFLRCRREIRRARPDVLLAMGSYSSLPPVLAAYFSGVPVVLHEANTVPGRAVEFLSRFARCVATSFESTARYLPNKKVVRTGLPVRADIAQGKRFGFIPPNAFVVFVTGGSQGAHRVNELASAALVKMARALAKRGNPAQRPLYVIHQTGRLDEGAVIADYARAALPARVHAFESDMPDAFASADFVVARAGASTCFELAACGKPALLIPLPSALRNHQHGNAQAFVLAGAADEGVQAELTADGLTHYLLAKYDRPDVLRKMGEKMSALAEPHAALRVAALVEDVAAEARAHTTKG